ncbi:MAG: type II secretion system protein [Verrucomicrobiota bacterium]
MCIINRRDARRGGLLPSNSIAPLAQSIQNLGLANHRRGFTLVEMMIVVVIIGLLAVIALPAFQNARTQSQNTRLANDLRQFRGAFETYNLENGDWPPDVNEGVLPAGMNGYIVSDHFASRTVVGGNYDWEGPGAFGSFSAGISIRNSIMDDDQARKLDEKIDDGNLGSGIFRNGISAGGYTLILEE